MYSNPPPCAACKFLRKKCSPTCIFAPYFSPEETTKFINAHKVFGACNVAKILKEIPPYHRDAAVASLSYEAEIRIKDPIYGCAGAISLLQDQVNSLQKQLDVTNAHIMLYAGTPEINSPNYGSGIPELGPGPDHGSGFVDRCLGSDYGSGLLTRVRSFLCPSGVVRVFRAKVREKVDMIVFKF